MGRYNLHSCGDIDTSIYIEILSLPSGDNMLPGKIAFEDSAGRFGGSYEISADGDHLEISSGDNSYLMTPVCRAGASYMTIDGLCYALAEFDIQEEGRQRSLSHVSVLMFDTDYDDMDYPMSTLLDCLLEV